MMDEQRIRRLERNNRTLAVALAAVILLMAGLGIVTLLRGGVNAAPKADAAVVISGNVATTGRLHVGSLATGTSTLDVSERITASESYQSAINSNMVFAPKADPSSYHAQVINANMVFAPSFNSEGAYLFGGTIDFQTNGTISCVSAFDTVMNIGAGYSPRIRNMDIIRAIMPWMESGHIKNLFGLAVRPATLSGTAVVDRMHGVHIYDLAGSVRPPVGVWIDAFSDSRGWGLYNESRSYFGDTVRIGDGVPLTFGDDEDIGLSSRTADQLDLTPGTKNGDVVLSVTGSGGLVTDGTFQAAGYKASSGAAGVTDDGRYWLCTAADCSTTCRVSIENGLIVGCR